MQSALSLCDALAERVLQRTGRRVEGLTVEVAEGSVVLRGVVRSYHVKQLAQHGAREILPDAKLHNAIVVQPVA